jgi:hypothetical protein
MSSRLLFGTVAILVMFGVNCMDLDSSFKKLDEYKSGKQSGTVELAVVYEEALGNLEREIVKLEKQLRQAEQKEMIDEEIEESAFDQRGIRATLALYRERLYDLSSNGELGRKIQHDETVTVTVKPFVELDDELKQKVKQ